LYSNFTQKYSDIIIVYNIIIFEYNIWTFVIILNHDNIIKIKMNDEISRRFNRHR